MLGSQLETCSSLSHTNADTDTEGSISHCLPWGPAQGWGKVPGARLWGGSWAPSDFTALFGCVCNAWGIRASLLSLRSPSSSARLSGQQRWPPSFFFPSKSFPLRSPSWRILEHNSMPSRRCLCPMPSAGSYEAISVEKPRINGRINEITSCNVGEGWGRCSLAA